MIRSKVYFFVSASNPFNSIRIQIDLISNLLRDLFHVETEIIHPGIKNYANTLKRVISNDEILFWHYGGLDFHLNILSKNKNITYVYHNITPSFFFWKTEPLVSIRSILGKIQLNLISKKKKWITMSDYNVSELKSIGFKNVFLCPNIISKNTNQRLPKTEEISLLYVGRIAPNKNCIFLLDQVEKVANKLLVPISLVVIGSAKEGCRYGKSFREKFKSLMSHEYLKINWKEKIDENQLNELYQQSWLYLSTSLHEGFGVPVCESIANGTPALYLKCGGQDSVLENVGLVSDQNIFDFIVTDLIINAAKRKELLKKQIEIVSKFCKPEINKIVYEVYEKNIS